MKKRFVFKKWYLIPTVILLLVAGLIVAIALQPRIDTTRTASIALGQEPSSLDPAISLTIDARSYISNMYEGLTNIAEDGTLKPGVADNWSTNDDKTEYTFTLRDNAVWSDGTPLTANDFKYSWVRVLNPDTASGWASFLYYIKGAQEYNDGTASAEQVGIEVVDDRNLKVTLASANSFFGAMTALQPYFPVKESVVTADPEAWATKPETYISNGAFKLSRWDHDSQIVVVRSEEYWNRSKVYLAQIDFKLFSEPAVVTSAFESGELTYVGKVIPSEQMKQVSELKNSNFAYTKFLSPNLSSAALKDQDVRKALSIALDRQEIATTVGDSEPLLSFIPQGFTNTAEKVDFRKDGNKEAYLDSSSNIDEAKKLLAQKGYNESNPLKLTYLTNTSGANVALAEVVKEQLKKANVEVEIQAYESKVFNTYRKEKKFDLVAASWAAEYPDISSYLYEFTSTDSNNYPGFKNSEYDALYKSLVSEQEGAKKYEIAHQAEDLLLNSYSVFPLYYQPDAYIVDGNFTGYYQDSTGSLVLRNAYFTSEK
ncbi:MAG: peptide ABC transporter substrate-binding protein [Candidatus Microsaccharimonas sp.]